MKIRIYSKISDFSVEELIDAADAKDSDSILEAANEAFVYAFDDDISDCFSKIPLSKESQGFFPDPGSIGEELCKQLSRCLEYRLGGKLYIDVINDSEAKIAIETINTTKILIGRFDREEFFIYVGRIVLTMLKNFLINGVWNYGLRRDDGTILTDTHNWPKPVNDGQRYTWHDSQGFLEPIIWFGMENQSPIECWTLDKSTKRFDALEVYANRNVESSIMERWSIFWFSAFRILDWDALFNYEGDIFQIWMFDEYVWDEPEEEFYAVRDSCPIKLDANDRSEGLISKIDELFVSKMLH
ncbi:MAG: hypothetical protein PHY48_04900 [Candidatus Cloacimonetes bacterium]|jgi:hypothetical protein|nr:hypothetical protein [Candidatus Cloacimonadota bacterium]